MSDVNDLWAKQGNARCPELSVYVRGYGMIKTLKFALQMYGRFQTELNLTISTGRLLIVSQPSEQRIVYEEYLTTEL